MLRIDCNVDGLMDLRDVHRNECGFHTITTRRSHREFFLARVGRFRTLGCGAIELLRKTTVLRQG